MPNRSEAIDFFRAIAVSCIVLIHTAPFVDMEGAGHWLGFALNTLARFAVPFFFMASGYLFALKLQQAQEPGRYFRGYVWKLIKLYAIWQIVYLAYDAITLPIGGFHTYKEAISEAQAMGVADLLKIAVGMPYYGLYSSGYQLWYLPTLILSIAGIYFAHRHHAVKRLIAVSAGLHFIGIVGNSYLGLFPRDFMSRDTIFFGLFYTMLGYCFYRYRATILGRFKAPASVWMSLFLLFLAVQIFERYMISEFLDVNAGDYFLSTIILSCSLFLFLMKRPDFGKGTRLSDRGQHAVGVFLVHLLFVNGAYLAMKVYHWEAAETKLLWHILFTPTVILLSYAVYVGLRRVSFTHRVSAKAKRRAAL